MQRLKQSKTLSKRVVSGSSLSAFPSIFLSLSAALGMCLLSVCDVYAQPLSLQTAIDQSFMISPSVVSSQAQVNQQQALLSQAKAGKRLQISFVSTPSVSTANVYQPPPSSETFAAIQNSLQIPIPIGSKPQAAIDQAQFQVDSSNAILGVARRALATQVRAAYFNLLRNRGLLTGANQQLTSAQQSLTNAQKRFAAGDVPQLDVIQAQSPVDSANAGVIEAQTQVSIAQETINSLLGQPLDSSTQLVDMADVGPAAPSITIDQARALAVQVSPDIAAASRQVDAAQAGVRVAAAYRDPSLSLQAIDLRSKDVTSFSSEDTLQAQVTVPLGDGGFGSAGIAAAQAALANAKAQKALAQQNAVVAVSAAYLNAQDSVAQLAAAKSARDTAQTTYDKTTLGYQDGLNSLTDVISAQSALGQARIAYIQALYNAAEAQADFNALISPADDGLAPQPAK